MLTIAESIKYLEFVVEAELVGILTEEDLEDQWYCWWVESTLYHHKPQTSPMSRLSELDKTEVAAAMDVAAYSELRRDFPTIPYAEPPTLPDE